MPSNNAYDFLRQSIAGQAPVTGSPRPASGVDYSAIQPEQLVYRAPGEQPREQMPVDLPPVPPILTLPPGVELLDFVGRVERAYDLHYTDEKYVAADMRTSEGNAEHAVELFEEGLAAITIGDYARASDMFSLCVILDPNYFYHFALANIRYNLADFEGNVAQTRIVLEQLRAGQKLSAGAGYYYSQTDFVDTLYVNYTISLIYTGNLDEAKRMVDFILSDIVLVNGISYIKIAHEFSAIGQLPTAAKLVERVANHLDALPNQESRDFVLRWIQSILKGEPGKDVINQAKT